MDLLPELKRMLKDIVDIPPGCPLVVGVSGGPDSLALLHLLTRVTPAYDLTAVHVHHGIRGPQADTDAAFVQDTARRWGILSRVVRIDVPALAGEHGYTLEEAARLARYTALAEAAAEMNSPSIVVGHNANDQAETVLMNLIRGSGLAGLTGMAAITPLSNDHLLRPTEFRGNIVRPLLNVTRADIDAYCKAQGLSPRLDETNADPTYTRNRIRQEILPRLEAINPNVVAALNRTADILRVDANYIHSELQQALMYLASVEKGSHVDFERKSWRSLPLALKRASIRWAVARLDDEQIDLSFEHVAAAVDVAHREDTGSQATLPGALTLHVDYDAIRISRTDDTTLPDWPTLTPGTTIDIPAPGIVALPGSTWQFEIKLYDGPFSGREWRSLLKDRWRTPLNGDRLRFPLTLRPRRDGDQFEPMGAGGTQKISDFMVNQKIPARWRGRVPLLISGGDIAWVCGWRVDERFAVDADTSTVWLARFLPPDETTPQQTGNE